MDFIFSIWHGVINVTASIIIAVVVHVPFLTNILVDQSAVSPVDSQASTIQQLGEARESSSHGPIKKFSGGVTITNPISQISLVYPNPSEMILNSRANKLPSLDGKISAVTYSTEEETVTVLVDSEDKQLTKVFWGSAAGWSPDQSKVYVFLSDRFSKDGRRHVYYLNRDGSVSDPGLPVDVYAMSISPDNKYIAYVKGSKGGDAADIYLRNTEGKDTILVKGNENIFTKLSWSADSKTLFYQKTDLFFRPGMQSNWSIRIDGSQTPQPLGS